MNQRTAANSHPTSSRRGEACSARGITPPHPSGLRPAFLPPQGGKEEIPSSAQSSPSLFMGAGARGWGEKRATSPILPGFARLSFPHKEGRKRTHSAVPYSPSPRQMERGVGGEANWIGSPSSELPPAFLPAHAGQEEAPRTAPYSPSPTRREGVRGWGVTRKAPLP